MDGNGIGFTGLDSTSPGKSLPCSVLITFQFSQRTVACDFMVWRCGPIGDPFPVKPERTDRHARSLPIKDPEN